MKSNVFLVTSQSVLDLFELSMYLCLILLCFCIILPYLSAMISVGVDYELV